MIWRTAASVALGAAIAFAGGFAWQARETAALRAEAAALRAELASCTGRLGAIERDRQSDRTVDDMDSDDLRRVPPGWLRP
jgi:hypothetical protein